MTDLDTLAAVERWFRSRGIPHLTAFSGFSFTVYVLTDATYRKEFLEEVLVELRQAFAVRAVYLASRGA